jgi:hypothetical protein
MPQKPFNEPLLWKGQIQKCQKPSKIRQPDMILPTINSVTGHYVPERPTIEEELLYRYSVYSREYWRGVKQRQVEYRLKYQL